MRCLDMRPRRASAGTGSSGQPFRIGKEKMEGARAMAP
jgi:hypothetical protein